MKKIVLHSATADNAGQYCDAGAALEVRALHGDADDAGKITAERAEALLEAGGAVSAAEAREEEQASAIDPLDQDVWSARRASLPAMNATASKTRRGGKAASDADDSA